jgi:hypothetical protein
VAEVSDGSVFFFRLSQIENMSKIDKAYSISTFNSKRQETSHKHTLLNFTKSTHLLRKETAIQHHQSQVRLIQVPRKELRFIPNNVVDYNEW